MKAVVICVILCLPWTFVLFGQTQSDTVRERMIDRTMATFGLSEKKLNKLKAEGIDVRDSLRKDQGLDEIVRATICDLVVIGEVIRLVDIPGPRSQLFHSKGLVQVINVLKGDLKGSRVIELLRESGPTSGDSSIWFSTDVRLTPGETALFFLLKPEHNSYLTIRYKRNFEDGEFTPASNAFWAGSGSKYPIKNGKVHFRGQERDVDEIARHVKTVDRILQNAE